MKNKKLKKRKSEDLRIKPRTRALKSLIKQHLPGPQSVWSRGNTNKFKILIIRIDKKDGLYGCIFKCTWNKNFLNK